jgi:hypothetical protein
MKRIACVVAALALGLIAAGCVLTSGQVRIPYELDTFTVSTESTITGQPVDLNTEEEYVENKDKLKGLSDMAVLGRFVNGPDAAIDVVVWMTPGLTSHTTVDGLNGDATKVKLWGPFKVNAGATVVVDWDESAELFTKEGKTALVNEVKGDGTFTLYAIAEQDTYTFRVENGTLVLVLDTEW